MYLDICLRRSLQRLAALVLPLFVLGVFAVQSASGNSLPGVKTNTEPDTVPPVHLSLSAQPSSAIADGVSAITIHGVLTDSLNAPIPGILITFDKGTDPGNSIVLQPITATTDLHGQITATVRSTKPGKVTIQAYGSVAANISTGIASVDITFLSTPVTVTLTASRLAIPADSATTSLITATVRSAGQPVAGRAITFSVTSGSLKPLTGISNNRGEVTTTLTASGAGNAMVTAHPDVGTPAQRTITIDNMNLHLPLAWSAAPPPPPLVTLRNGSFETDEAWTQTPAGKIIFECKQFQGSALGDCHEKRMAWLGGLTIATTQSIAQALALTKSYPVTVRFEYFMATPPSGCENDFFEVWIGSKRLAGPIKLCNYTSPQWVTTSVVLPAIDGIHELKFQVVAPGGVASSIFIDDVSLCSTSAFKHPEMPACP